jgi:hypothetical protein
MNLVCRCSMYVGQRDIKEDIILKHLLAVAWFSNICTVVRLYTIQDMIVQSFGIHTVCAALRPFKASMITVSTRVHWCGHDEREVLLPPHLSQCEMLYTRPWRMCISFTPTVIVIPMGNVLQGPLTCPWQMWTTFPRLCHKNW